MYSGSLSLFRPICEVEFLVKNPIKIHYIFGNMIFSRKSLVKLKIIFALYHTTYKNTSTHSDTEEERESLSNNQIHTIHTPLNRHLIWLNANQAIIHILSISQSQRNWKKESPPLYQQNWMESRWRAQVHFYQ